MQISGISVDDSPFATEAPAGSSELDKDAFLQLLVSKLKNQDPVQPEDSSEFVNQLTAYSQLEETQNLNDNIVTMVLLQQQNALMSQLTDASGLIGQTVNYLDPTTGAEQTGTVGSVKIEEGLAVLNVDGESVPLANVSEVLGNV